MLERTWALLERFLTNDAITSAEVEGTGLGLNVAKLIVEEHGGTIGFTSDMGKGTAFYFDLQKITD